MNFSAVRQVWFYQAMKMDDHVFHLGIIDRSLRLSAPGFLSLRIAGIDAHEVHPVKIGIFERPGVFDPAAHDEVEKLFCHR